MENIFNDLLTVVHQQQADKVWVCLTCGNTTLDFMVCETCDRISDDQQLEQDQEL